MKVETRAQRDYWSEIKDATMNTIGKNTGKYPDPVWKRKLLLAEHSPIRKLKVAWRWLGLKYWVSVHFVRHKIGIEHFVSTQRTDRTNIDRNELRQDALVNHECEASAQAIINISRKRLCTGCASPETTEAWKMFLDEVVAKTEPELRSVCVRECVYRNGLCPEVISCGFNHTDEFKKELDEYLKGVENRVSNYYKK